MEKTTELGLLCRKLRIDKKLTMKAFAEKVGKSQSYISGIENGDIPLTYDYITACINVYDLTQNERLEFLVKALSCSEKMDIPLKKVTIIQQDRFLLLLACFLLNYEPPYLPDCEWNRFIRAGLYELRG